MRYSDEDFLKDSLELAKTAGIDEATKLRIATSFHFGRLKFHGFIVKMQGSKYELGVLLTIARWFLLRQLINLDSFLSHRIHVWYIYLYIYHKHELSMQVIIPFVPWIRHGF